MVAAALALVAFLAVVVDAAWWVVALAALLTLPALADILRGARARLTLDDGALAWTSGSRGRTVPLSEIDEVVLTTALDFSQRAKVLLCDGGSHRIPPECLPGGRILDAEFAARSVPHRRGLFSL